jgi:hypothetical protein
VKASQGRMRGEGKEDGRAREKAGRAMENAGRGRR